MADEDYGDYGLAMAELSRIGAALERIADGLAEIALTHSDTGRPAAVQQPASAAAATPAAEATIPAVPKQIRPGEWGAQTQVVGLEPGERAELTVTSRSGKSWTTMHQVVGHNEFGTLWVPVQVAAPQRTNRRAGYQPAAAPVPVEEPF